MSMPTLTTLDGEQKVTEVALFTWNHLVSK